ncbi:MAG TPA: hypothetical protein VGM13_13315 [Thermoanaerobaculia bacterium]|jgi:hypothetical protein
MDTRRIVAFAALGTLAGAAALAVFLAGSTVAPGARFQPVAPPGDDFALLPESGRTFARVVSRGSTTSSRARWRDAGIAVVPLPLYPSGEGGMHCMMLR